MQVTLDLTQPTIYKTFKENLELVFNQLKTGLNFSIFTVDQLIVFNSLIQLSTIKDWEKFSEHDSITNYKKYYIPDLMNIRLFFNGYEVLKNKDNAFNIDELSIDINNYNNFQFALYSAIDNYNEGNFIESLESINNG